MASDAAKDLLIGNNIYRNRTVNGMIDDVKIYDYVLTPRQIAMEYNDGRPIAYWKFDKGEGGTAYDYSGNGNNGIIYPGTSGANTSTSTMWSNGSNGKVNGSLDFDGTDDYVEVASDQVLNVDYVTVSLWAKSDVAGSVYSNSANLLNKLNTNAGTYAFYLEQANDKITFQVRLDGSESTQRYVYANNTLDTSWHHYVGVYDGEKVKLYIDGELQEDTNSISGSIDKDNSGVLRIGTHPTNSYNFNGQIDEIKIWNYPLTSEEVKKEYNGGFGIKFK